MYVKSFKEYILLIQSISHNNSDHCQVTGNTGNPADRDYVNEAVDYFKNKLRLMINIELIFLMIMILMRLLLR